jgi:hypothetical protein
MKRSSITLVAKATNCRCGTSSQTHPSVASGIGTTIMMASSSVRTATRMLRQGQKWQARKNATAYATYVAHTARVVKTSISAMLPPARIHSLARVEKRAAPVATTTSTSPQTTYRP